MMIITIVIIVILLLLLLLIIMKMIKMIIVIINILINIIIIGAGQLRAALGSRRRQTLGKWRMGSALMGSLLQLFCSWAPGYVWTSEPSCSWTLGSDRDERVVINEVTTANCMFFDRGTFWVFPFTYFLYHPNSARAYLFPQPIKIHYFCSGPASVDPMCPQPNRIPRAEKDVPAVAFWATNGRANTWPGAHANWASQKLQVNNLFRSLVRIVPALR